VPALGPLAGIRVLDLTRVLAGPFASLMLADLGAEVIKVERPRDGDETRHVEPMREGESHYFIAVNRNKLGIAVDMKDPRGHDIVAQLAARSDVLLENFRPGVIARLGLDYETLRGASPRLIYCSISAFGQTGPYARRSALDVAVQALSGAMSLTGDPDGPPTRMGLPMADLCGALMAVIGIQAALLERERTGRGQLVDISLHDGMISLLMYLAGRYFFTGEDPAKVGTGHHGIVPYGAFQASDGYMVIANIGESFWPKICRAIGRPELANDPRYDSNAKRVARRGEVDLLLKSVMLKQTAAYWDRMFDEHDVPHAPILRVSEALGHPQTVARGMVTEIEHPLLGPLKALGRPIRMPYHDAAAIRSAPLLGEHSAAVLRDVLGYGPQVIAELASQGVISLGGRVP
jgi:crotonobetainyl-CoA:carnitine CoA-transferase CaiB-like acyl-CoA transferase